MTATEIRAKYWQLHNSVSPPGQPLATIDRRIAMAQTELIAEATAQLAEINAVMQKIALLNFEELALRLEDFFRKTGD